MKMQPTFVAEMVSAKKAACGRENPERELELWSTAVEPSDATFQKSLHPTCQPVHIAC